MSKKIGLVCMTTGMLLIMCALLLLVYNTVGDSIAGNDAQEVLSALNVIIADNKAKIASNQGNEAEVALETIDNLGENADEGSSDENSLHEMPTVTVNGVEYIGVISLPKYGIELPVQALWSEEGLKTGPGRYSGTLDEGNLIIAGHNYRTHFGNLTSTKVGETIIFTDIYGNEYTYTVSDVVIIDGNDSASMLAGSDEWDLTLFTCTLSRTTRVTVRCVLVD